MRESFTRNAARKGRELQKGRRRVDETVRNFKKNQRRVDETSFLAFSCRRKSRKLREFTARSNFKVFIQSRKARKSATFTGNGEQQQRTHFGSKAVLRDLSKF